MTGKTKRFYFCTKHFFISSHHHLWHNNIVIDKSVRARYYIRFHQIDNLQKKNSFCFDKKIYRLLFGQSMGCVNDKRTFSDKDFVNKLLQ